MAKNNIILFTERHCIGEKLEISHRRRGIVRIVEEHDFGFFRHIGRNSCKVRQEFILGRQRHIMRHTVCEHGAQFINRISRVGNQRIVAGIDKSQENMGDAFFGADQGHYFAGRIQCNIKTFFIPSTDGAAELRRTFIIGITMVLRCAHCLAHFFHDLRRSRLIRISNAKTDNVNAPFNCFPFFLVNRRKQIRRDFFNSFCSFQTIHPPSIH